MFADITQSVRTPAPHRAAVRAAARRPQGPLCEYRQCQQRWAAALVWRALKDRREPLRNERRSTFGQKHALVELMSTATRERSDVFEPASKAAFSFNLREIRETAR